MKNFLFSLFRFKSTKNASVICLLMVLTALLSISSFMGIASVAQADDVTLAWDPNESEPDGYRVYIRAEDEAYDYTVPAWTGIDTTTTFPNLTNGQTYHFVVRAYIGSMESNDSNEITYTVGQNETSGESDGIVIDDGDQGVTSTGSWHVSKGSDPYGDQSLYSIHPGDSYSYSAELSGSYEVSLWWTGFGNRCDNVAVEIYDDDALLNTIYVNQRNDSGQWYSLGNYDFAGTAAIHITSGLNLNGRPCSTCADAISFTEN